MSKYDTLREVAILPCLHHDLSVEDERLEANAPSFGLEHARPNAMLGRVLSFLNVSKPTFLALVEKHRGIKLTSGKAHGSSTGAWRYRPEDAPAWRALKVQHDPSRPQLLDDSEIYEIFDNASYGGQLAIAGMVDANFCLPKAPYPALRLTGRFQIGIIDYIWGSGHTVTWDGELTVNMTQGQAGDPIGYEFNDVCDFSIPWFRFNTIARGELAAGIRWQASRKFPLAAAA
jgi:hypothetical protein